MCLARRPRFGIIPDNRTGRFTPAAATRHNPGVYSIVTHDQDLEFVRSVLGGDPADRESFCVRMRCIGRMLTARNRRFGRPLDDHDIADLAQETALAVWRRLSSYAGRASLETWVYKYCALTMSNALRKKRTTPRRLSELGVDGAPELAETSPGTQEPTEPTTLDSMLGHLSQRQAEVLRLRHVDGLGNREIGEALDISINSVKTHSLHAMTRLRQLFGSRTPEEA